MIKIGEKGRVLIALVLTFGVLAYIVQGDQQGAKEAGVDLPAERPVQQTADQADNSGAAKVAAPVKEEAAAATPKAEDILSQADSRAAGGTAFFIEYRLERDRQRSQQIALLKQIIDNTSTDGEGKQEAQKRLVELTQQMDLEMQLEKLIVAKGYKDAAVFIQPNAVNVIVMADKFGNEDANKIGDMVSRSTGRPREQISMIHKQ